MPVGPYKDLVVWQKSMTLARQCYTLTESFPKSEVFGITPQIRRAVVSISCNIDEGWGREGTKEFIQFLRIAQGSLKEVETLLLLAQSLYVNRSDAIAPLLSLIDEIGRMLRALLAKLKAKSAKPK